MIPMWNLLDAQLLVNNVFDCVKVNNLFLGVMKEIVLFQRKMAQRNIQYTPSILI